MRGRYLVPDARQKKVIADGAIAIAGGRVADSGSFAEVRSRHPQARVLGNGRQLLMPGLIDAHSHGRGLSPIQ